MKKRKIWLRRDQLSNIIYREMSYLVHIQLKGNLHRSLIHHIAEPNHSLLSELK